MDHAAYVDAAAATLGLKIAAEHRPGVLQFFALAASMAELVQGLPLEVARRIGQRLPCAAAAGRRAMSMDAAASIAARVRDGTLSARQRGRSNAWRASTPPTAAVNAFSAGWPSAR